MRCSPSPKIAPTAGWPRLAPTANPPQSTASQSEDARIAETLSNLAVVHQLLGDYTGALPLFEQALQIRERAGDALRIAETLNNLANLLHDLGDLAAALRFFSEWGRKQVIIIFKRLCGFA